MNIERKVHKYKKIPITEIQIDIDKWYSSKNFSDDEVTIFKIRNIWLIDDEIENKVITLMIKSIKDINRKNEYNENNDKIDSINDPILLWQQINDGNYTDNVIYAITKILMLDNNFYIKVLQDLELLYSEIKFDNSLRILARTIKKIDISNLIWELLKKDKIRDPQDFASLLQLIGISKNMQNINLLFSFVNYFELNFTDESFFEGPLFGVGYILKKFG